MTDIKDKRVAPNDRTGQYLASRYYFKNLVRARPSRNKLFAEKSFRALPDPR
jgi:hypothetical protein